MSVPEILHRPGPARHHVDSSDPGCLDHRKGSCDNLLGKGLPKDAMESSHRLRLGLCVKSPPEASATHESGEPCPSKRIGRKPHDRQWDDMSKGTDGRGTL